MRFSYSIRKNIFEAFKGALLNNFYLKKRRDTLIFSDILANYIKECEEAGYGAELGDAGQQWMILYFKNLVPDILKKMPPVLFLNTVMKNVWINLGLLDDLIAARKGNRIIIKTRNEQITRMIWKNDFLPALYKGALSALFNSRIRTAESFQTKDKNRYNRYEFAFDSAHGAIPDSSVYGSCSYDSSSYDSCSYDSYSYDSYGSAIEKEPLMECKSKEKSVYFKLNYFPSAKGFRLSDAFKSGVLQLKGNNIFFRGALFSPAENTIFHLLGKKQILISRLSSISYEYFRKIICESKDEEKLVVLKTLLQTMGWGAITCILDKRSTKRLTGEITKINSITIEIKNPPFGLQAEKDNWIFLIAVILGYMWLLDANLKITCVKERNKSLAVTFS